MLKWPRKARRAATAATNTAATATTATVTAARVAISHADRKQFLFKDVGRLGRQGQIEDLACTRYVCGFVLTNADLSGGFEAMLEQDGLGIGQQPVLECVIGPSLGNDPAPLLVLNPLLFTHWLPLSSMGLRRTERPYPMRSRRILRRTPFASTIQTEPAPIRLFSRTRSATFPSWPVGIHPTRSKSHTTYFARYHRRGILRYSLPWSIESLDRLPLAKPRFCGIGVAASTDEIRSFSIMMTTRVVWPSVSHSRGGR